MRLLNRRASHRASLPGVASVATPRRLLFLPCCHKHGTTSPERTPATGAEVGFQKKCDYTATIGKISLVKALASGPKVLGSNVQRPENLEWRNFMFAREEKETCNAENQT